MPKKLARHVIRRQIDEEPARRPYAARVNFALGANISLQLEESVCLLTADDTIIRLAQATDPAPDPHQNLNRYTAHIEGFTTAGEAETAGLRLALALLWAAISRRSPMRLEYHTPLPCVVYDRTPQNQGIRMFATATARVFQRADYIARSMDKVLTQSVLVDRQLLLSMELFAAARLEASERARFISLVSALEPLATPMAYPASIRNLITKFREELKRLDVPELAQDPSADRIKTSLDGRLRELEQESIRQALLRIVRDALPDDAEAVRTIDNAYNLRSKMLHEGASDPYLDRLITKVEEIMRQMYAVRLGTSLSV